MPSATAYFGGRCDGTVTFMYVASITLRAVTSVSSPLTSDEKRPCTRPSASGSVPVRLLIGK